MVPMLSSLIFAGILFSRIWSIRENKKPPELSVLQYIPTTGTAYGVTRGRHVMLPTTHRQQTYFGHRLLSVR
jgi:hypothetical protein